MINIEEERKAFEIEWIKLGGDFKSFSIIDNMYVLIPSMASADDVIKEFAERAVNSAFALWLIQSRQKQVVIDDLNIQLKDAKATPEGFVLEQKNWISVEIGTPAKFGTRVKIKRKSWDEEDNLVFIESEATYDKDSDFCELSNRSYEYETWFDHSLNKYLEEDEITHWMPLTKEAQEQSHDEV